jgi:hypothetical protein
VALTLLELPAPILAPDRADESAARRTLRDQIARLEREAATEVAVAFPRLEAVPPTPGLAGPRLLSLGELERVRDALAGHLAHLRRQVAEQAERQAEARALLADMLEDPAAYKWIRVSNEDLGEPGCKHYHARPRLGPVGLLLGWWRVKVSSGCPLAAGA